MLLHVTDGKRTIDLGVVPLEELRDPRSWSAAALFDVDKGAALAVVGEKDAAVELFTRAMGLCNHGIKQLSALNDERYAYCLWSLHLSAFVATWFLTGQEHKDHLAAAVPPRAASLVQDKGPQRVQDVGDYILVCLEVGNTGAAQAAYALIRTSVVSTEAALKGKPTSAKALYLAIFHQANPAAMPADLLARRLAEGAVTAIRSGAMTDPPDMGWILFWLRLHSRIVAPEPDPWKLMQRLNEM